MNSLRHAPLALLFLPAFGAGCGTGAAPDSHVVSASEHAPSAREEEGVVHLSTEARAFVRTLALVGTNDVTVLQAPAQVAFRDGATAQIGAPVAGRVSAVHVRVGEAVAEGAPLLTLRSPDAAASRAELAATRAALETALNEARRTAEMFEHGVGTERERRAADLEVARLEIDLARARTVTSFLGRGVGGDVVVRAPFAGTVLSRRASIGLAAEPGGEPLVELGDPARIGVVAEVFDRDATSIQPGASVEFRVASHPEPLRGHVTYLAPVVSSGTRTLPVLIELDSIEGSLRPGMFGRVSITTGAAGIVLPNSAVLLRDGRRSVVYVDEGEGTYARRDVTIRPSIDGHVQVLEGLALGDLVVVEGALLLDGAADLLL